MNDRPKGQRFSHQYLSRPEGLKDSPRIRTRVGALFTAAIPENKRDWDFAAFIKRETGEQVPWLGTYGPDWEKFFGGCPLDTLLDCVTVVVRGCGTAYRQSATTWIVGCERIFREEQAAYTVDELGGVHPYVDAAFHQARLSTIAALNGARYVTPAASLNKAYDSLHGAEVQARAAVRHTFDAAETLYKMLVPSSPRLTGSDAKTKLAALIDRILGGNPVAQRASHQLLSSFADWVDAAHHYRHAPGEAEPPEPPNEVWQLLINNGAGFVRWLAQLDGQAKATKVAG
jgi:hypothetical protein